MKIVLATTVFRFSLFSGLFFICVLALLIFLGVWQLGRADEKKVFLAEQKVSEKKEKTKFASLIEMDLERIRYRKTELTGTYDSDHQYLIDNQILNGQVGYLVITPFKIAGMDKSILVNRGWVALNKYEGRDSLPNLKINKLTTAITGRINNFPSVGIRLEGAEIPTKGWPSIVQVVDISVLSNYSSYSFFPFQIELDAAMEDGYLREWKKIKIMQPEKHIAYAVQWFGLAITLVILFFWINKEVE